MVIAVTGGHGFLGSEIARQANHRGDAVVQMGRPDEDIPSPRFAERLRDTAPDVLVHAAGPASVALSMADAAADRAGSVDVTGAVLSEAARLPRPPRIALVSSAAVYGQPLRLPVSEAQPLAPISPYGHHRAACEELLSHHRAKTGAGVLALRVFSAYGEGLRRQLLWDIARQAVARSEVVLGGTGEETRDFVHVSDVAGAALAAIDHAPFADERLNVATGRETPIQEIARALLGALGLPGRSLVFTGDERPGDPKRWRADISLIRGLGFSPRMSQEEGLRRCGRWLREVLNVAGSGNLPAAP